MNEIRDENGGSNVEGGCEINSQRDDGEIDRKNGRLFDYEVCAYWRNSIIDKLETLKKDKESIYNS